MLARLLGKVPILRTEHHIELSARSRPRRTGNFPDALLPKFGVFDLERLVDRNAAPSETRRRVGRNAAKPCGRFEPASEGQICPTAPGEPGRIVRLEPARTLTTAHAFIADLSTVNEKPPPATASVTAPSTHSRASPPSDTSIAAPGLS